MRIQRQHRKNKRNRIRAMYDALEIVDVWGWKAVPDAASGDIYYFNGKMGKMVWEKPTYEEMHWYATTSIQKLARGWLVRLDQIKLKKYILNFCVEAISFGIKRRIASLLNKAFESRLDIAVVAAQKIVRGYFAKLFVEKLRPKTPPLDPRLCTKCMSKKAVKCCVDCGDVKYCFLCYEANHLGKTIHTFVPIEQHKGRQRIRRALARKKKNGCEECTRGTQNRECITCARRICFSCAVAPGGHIELGHKVVPFSTENVHTDTVSCCGCDEKPASRLCRACINDNSNHPRTGQVCGLFCDSCFRNFHACSNCSDVAILSCGECEKKYCASCIRITHSRGKKRAHKLSDGISSHSFVSFTPHGNVSYRGKGESLSSVLEICKHCKGTKRIATEWCVDCDDKFCIECYTLSHGKGKRTMHNVYSAVTEPGVAPRPKIIPSDALLPGNVKASISLDNIAFCPLEYPVAVLMISANTGFAPITSIEVYFRPVTDDEFRNDDEADERCKTVSHGLDPEDLLSTRDVVAKESTKLLGARNHLQGLKRQHEIALKQHETKWRLDCEKKSTLSAQLWKLQNSH